MEDDIAVENLRTYLKIPTVHPNVDYGPVVQFLKKIAEDLQLPAFVYEPVSANPVVVITWTGTRPSLPSIFLNSHTDTVPVTKSNWLYDPFGAVIDDKGDVYGRGAQDCKSVGIIHLEAIRRLKNRGVRLQRTVHAIFVPDEEVGGGKGMGAFVYTRAFRELNVGFAIDEGVVNPDDKFTISYSDRLSWRIVVECRGTSGDTSSLSNNTAAEKVSYILGKFYELRHAEKRKLEDDTSVSLSDCISVNLTQVQSDEQNTTLPQKLSMVLDCRLPPSTDLEMFEATMNGWLQEAGDQVSVNFLIKDQAYSTTLDTTSTYWVAFEKVLKKLNIPYDVVVYSATTDARHLRRVGVPCVGFIPIRNTIPRKHNDNEYLNLSNFFEAIDFYTKLLPALANS